MLAGIAQNRRNGSVATTAARESAPPELQGLLAKRFEKMIDGGDLPEWQGRRRWEPRSMTASPAQNANPGSKRSKIQSGRDLSRGQKKLPNDVTMDNNNLIQIESYLKSLIAYKLCNATYFTYMRFATTLVDHRAWLEHDRIIALVHAKRHVERQFGNRVSDYRDEAGQASAHSLWQGFATDCKDTTSERGLQGRQRLYRQADQAEHHRDGFRGQIPETPESQIDPMYAQCEYIVCQTTRIRASRKKSGVNRKKYGKCYSQKWSRSIEIDDSHQVSGQWKSGISAKEPMRGAPTIPDRRKGANSRQARTEHEGMLER